MYGVTGPFPVDELQIGSRIDILAPDIMHDDIECLIHPEKWVLGWSTFSSIQERNVLNIFKCGMFLG